MAKAGPNKIAGLCKLCGNRVRANEGIRGSGGVLVCKTCWNQVPESAKDQG